MMKQKRNNTGGGAGDGDDSITGGSTASRVSLLLQSSLGRRRKRGGRRAEQVVSVATMARIGTQESFCRAAISLSPQYTSPTIFQSKCYIFLYDDDNDDIGYDYDGDYDDYYNERYTRGDTNINDIEERPLPSVIGVEVGKGTPDDDDDERDDDKKSIRTIQMVWIVWVKIK